MRMVQDSLIKCPSETKVLLQPCSDLEKWGEKCLVLILHVSVRYALYVYASGKFTLY